MTATRILALISGVASLIFLTVMVPRIGTNQMMTGSGDFYSVGPTALPNLAGGLVLVFSIIMLATEHQKHAPQPRFTAGIGHGLSMIALFMAYAGGMMVIGFLPASMIFLAAIFVLYRAGSWVVSAILIVGVPLLVDQILRKLFLVPLPGGLLFQ